MQAIKLCFVIFNLEILHTFQSDFFGGFENEKNCITIKINQSEGVIIVKKNSTAVLNWACIDNMWKSTIGETYQKRISANNGIVEKLEFCFENTSRDDSGIYLWRDFKNITHDISFSVRYAAKINLTLQGTKTVKEYSSVNITCCVDSNPLSNISLSKENKKINAIHNVGNEAMLHFKNTTCGDTGIYECSAFNGIGTKDTKDIKLDVLCKPSLVDNNYGYGIEKRIIADLKEVIKRKVFIQANPTPYVMSNNSDIDANISITSNTTYSVLLRKVVSSEHDFRQHYLFIGNSEGNLTIEIKIEKRTNNYDAAKINLTLQGTKTVKEYSSVNITCCVDSYPLSNISWSKDNKKINAIHNVENEAMLHFKNTTCGDTGIYECSAFNGIGTKDTKNIKLDVLCKPSLVDNNYGYGIENRIIADLKEEIKMNVSIQANPTPYVISSNSDIDANISITSNTIYSVLLKKVVSSEHDFRQHYLFIGNSEGNLTVEIEIEQRTNNYAIDFKYIIGIPLLLVILISILILTVIKRVKRRKDHHANSNPTNNAYTGEYRDNILYQSIETVSLQASFESLFSSSNPSLNECHGGDVVKNPWAKTNIGEGQSNRKSDKCNRAENSGDKIKGRKPLPRPRKTKMQPENVDKVKQKASNLGNQTLPDPRGSDLETERSRPTAFDSDNSFNDEPKYNIETSTRENVNRSMKQANQSRSENEMEFPRKKFDHFHAHMGQDMEQQRHLNHGIKPNRFNTEERDIPKTNSLATEHCEYFGDTEDGRSVPKLELSCEDDTQKDEDDPSQYHDYMNI